MRNANGVFGMTGDSDAVVSHLKQKRYHRPSRRSLRSPPHLYNTITEIDELIERFLRFWFPHPTIVSMSTLHKVEYPRQWVDEFRSYLHRTT